MHNNLLSEVRTGEIVREIVRRMMASKVSVIAADGANDRTYDGHNMDVIIARCGDYFKVYEVPEDNDLPVREYLPPSEWLPFLREKDLADNEMQLWHARFVASEEEGMFEVTDIERFSRVVVR